MTIKSLFSLITIFLLATPLYGFNPKRLELEADIHYTRIFSNIPPEEEMIKTSVAGFLRDNESFQTQHAQLETFQKFYHDLIQQTEEENLITFFERQNLSAFSEICKKIYDENDERYRTGICLLLGKVQEKSLERLVLLKKLRNFKMQEYKEQKNLDEAEIDELLKFFF